MYKRFTALATDSAYQQTMTHNSIVAVGLLIAGTFILLLAWWLKRQSANRETNIASLMYALTHDELSNPLQSAMAAVDNIDRENSNRRPEERLDLADLKNSLARISGTTKNLRTLALMEMPRSAKVRERINAVATLQSVVVDIGAKAETVGVRVVYEGDDAPVYVLEQPANLQRIFQNVIDNAIKYTEGCINASVVINTANDKKYFKVTVSDNGKGMAPERVATIGKVPQRPTAQNIGTRGSGLGLYLVTRILRQAGGCLNISSELDKGTTVDINIPCKHQQ